MALQAQLQCFPKKSFAKSFHFSKRHETTGQCIAVFDLADFLEVEATLIKEKAGDSMDPSYVIEKTCEVQQVLLDDENIIKNE